jgi:hypothetical protein
MLSFLKTFMGKAKAQYKCPQDGCKYVSDKPGECCHKPLVKKEDGDESESEGCGCC